MDSLEPCPVCGVEGFILRSTGRISCNTPNCLVGICIEDWNTLSRAVQFQRSVVRCGECVEYDDGYCLVWCKPMIDKDYCSRGEKEVRDAE